MGDTFVFEEALDLDPHPPRFAVLARADMLYVAIPVLSDQADNRGVLVPGSSQIHNSSHIRTDLVCIQTVTE